MDEKRLDYLDMVKGIGIALVVIGHSPGVSDHILIWITSFHMPLFFIVSGILFAYKRSDHELFTTYVKSRICSTMIPYFCFSLINIIVDWGRYMRAPEAVGWGVVQTDIMQFLSLFGVSVLWFLPSLFLGGLCLYGIVKKCPVWLRCVIGVASAVLSTIGARLVLTFIPMGKNIFFAWLGSLLIALLRAFPALAFMLIGYGTYFLLHKLRWKTVWEVLLGAGCLGINAAAAFANAGVDLHYLMLNNVLLYYLGAGSATFGLILICRHIKPFRLPVFLGKNSLIIMVTHLDCRVMRAAIIFAEGMNRLIPGAVMFRVSLYLALLLGELAMILLINRFGFFLIGRRKPVKI